MNELIFLVEEAPEGGYTAKALGQGIFTEADTIEELKVMVKDSILCHFDKHLKLSKKEVSSRLFE